ncbi:MAG TPA: COX15/CtaA family protein [Longimicrobiaceae bacterium]|nr:COX15/CtaA family protein [Longimicrobiaceae bacterium]
MTRKRLAIYAWAVLGFNLLVVLWGAYVRASGSGAGCGRHWPLCNGTVVPNTGRVATLIEFTHRASSGAALVAVVLLLFWAWRAYPRGHRVRRGATAAMGFMILEALLGAGLVLFGLVAEDQSAFRAFSMAAHLINTFLLIGSITLTAWWASGGVDVRLRRQGMIGALLLIGIVAMLALGASGSIAALGDTLFPARSLAQGLQQDFDPTSHFLLRLRVYHPVLAIGTGLYLVVVARLAARLRPGAATRRLAWALTAVVLTQILVGVVNIALLAPVPVQLIHLLLADLLWISLVLLAGSALAAPAGTAVDTPRGDGILVVK